MLKYGSAIARLAPIIEHIGKPSFGKHYLEFMHGQLKVTQCSVLAFRGDSQPIPVVLESMNNEDHFLRSSRKYVEEGYRTDPLLKQDKPGKPIVVQMSASDYSDKLVQEIFCSENVKYELLLVGEVSGFRLTGCLQRPADAQPFGDEEIEFVSSSFPFFAQMIRKHFELLPEVDHHLSSFKEQGHKLDMLIEHFSLFLKKDPGHLTPREIEICALIIIGCSSTAISHRLHISESTIATHRKRLYQKLGISSQNELFLRYFQRGF